MICKINVLPVDDVVLLSSKLYRFSWVNEKQLLIEYTRSDGDGFSPIRPDISTYEPQVESIFDGRIIPQRGIIKINLDPNNPHEREVLNETLLRSQE